MRKNETSRAQATFIWDYDHYFILEKLSKLVPKWRRVWQDAAPWNDVVYHQAAVRLQRYMNGEKLDDFFSSLMEDKSGRPCERLNQTPKDRTYGSIQRDYLLWRGKKEAEIKSP